MAQLVVSDDVDGLISSVTVDVDSVGSAAASDFDLTWLKVERLVSSATYDEVDRMVVDWPASADSEDEDDDWIVDNGLEPSSTKDDEVECTKVVWLTSSASNNSEVDGRGTDSMA